MLINKNTIGKVVKTFDGVSVTIDGQKLKAYESTRAGENSIVIQEGFIGKYRTGNVWWKAELTYWTKNQRLSISFGRDERRGRCEINRDNVKFSPTEFLTAKQST